MEGFDNVALLARRFREACEVQEGSSFFLIDILRLCLNVLHYAQARMIRDARNLPFPRCWDCGSSNDEVYSDYFKERECFYCRKCWTSFLNKKKSSWDEYAKNLLVANPSSCHICDCTGLELTSNVLFRFVCLFS